MSKLFPIGAVLSVTTGRLLTKPDRHGNGIGQMYELLEYMTGDAPWTHQLGRFAEECKPWLLRQHPNLADHADDIATLCDTGNVQACMELIERVYGATIAVDRIPQDDHEHKDPYDELVAMRGTDEGIILIGVEGEE